VSDPHIIRQPASGPASKPKPNPIASNQSAPSGAQQATSANVRKRGRLQARVTNMVVLSGRALRNPTTKRATPQSKGTKIVTSANQTAKAVLIEVLQSCPDKFRLADIYLEHGLDSRQMQRHFGDPEVAAAVRANDWVVCSEGSYVFERRSVYMARMPEWYRNSTVFENGASATPAKWISQGESGADIFLRNAAAAVAKHKEGAHKARAARSAAQAPAPLKYGVSKKDNPAAYMRARRAAQRGMVV
jgi:hypothetical protein